MVTLPPLNDFKPKTEGKVFDPSDIQTFGIDVNYIDKEVTDSTMFFDSIKAVKQ